VEDLRDIKEIVEINESSLEIFLVTIALALLLFALGVYFFKNKRRRRKKPTQRVLAKEVLESLDYDNTKELVYGFLEHGKMFVNEKNGELFQNIEKDLEVYKYKKEVPLVDEKIKKQMKEFVKGVKA
jgi:hypothetical protein